MSNLKLEQFLKEYYGTETAEPTPEELETVARNHKAILQSGHVVTNPKPNRDLEQK